MKDGPLFYSSIYDIYFFFNELEELDKCVFFAICQHIITVAKYTPNDLRKASPFKHYSEAIEAFMEFFSKDFY